MGNSNTKPSATDGEIEDAPALVPPGEYQVRLRNWWTGMLFGGKAAKLVLNLEIVEFGEHLGKRLQRWYNVRRLVGKPGPNGGFKAGWSSDLVREYATLISLAPNQRNDRIALSRYKPLVLVADVVTVEEDAKQNKLPPALQ